MNNQRKSPSLYIAILGIWLLLTTVAIPPLLLAIIDAEDAGWIVGTLVVISSLFIAYFWLNGVKDIVYTIYYHVVKESFYAPPLHLWLKRYGAKRRPRVVMVYCTYNDFNAESLAACMHQDYKNYKIVILDDSTKDEYKNTVDIFANHYGLQVIRRDGHVGFKAGNLNNYLMVAKYDFFVILDSDEIVPDNFISRSLDYFADNKSTGIVQANHIATRNRNGFMDMFAMGVNSHWPTYQSVKDHAGFLSLLGHGAMVSRKCYFAAGGFPHVVAEDLCFSIAAREKGYYVSFAKDIICEEEYPIDYLAFKKRHSKWTQGNMEFIKKFTHVIIASPMRWFEKLDIVLFTYNLPLTAFFALYVVINVILLPLFRYTVNYPLWLILPTIIFLLAPMLNDIITYRKSLRASRMIWYLLHTFMLYGSMLLISLVSSTKSFFGRSVFLVTPKTSLRITLLEAIKTNRAELWFAVILSVVSLALSHSILPVVLIVIPSILSVYMAMMANKERYDDDTIVNTSTIIAAQKTVLINNLNKG